MARCHLVEKVIAGFHETSLGAILQGIVRAAA